MKAAYTKVDDLALENQRLLEELEQAYKTMEVIFAQADEEKQIAYRELEKKYNALEHLYGELSKKENLLIHLEKLSSIGQFISEIIHELKSPISAIAAHVELIKMQEPPAEVLKSADKISEHIYQLNDYLNRFRGMIYRGEEDFQIFDLNHNLIECLGTIEIIRPKHIVIATDLWKGMMPVKGDPYQTNQVFLNLAKNAFDAMESGGNLLNFRTRVVDAEWASAPENFSSHFSQPVQVWQELLAGNPAFALVEIEDTGKGIAPENLSSIFKAFFTTKERGKGTGLGLSICSDIAKRHCGNLAVKSEAGVGTTFQFILPLQEFKREAG